MLPIQALAENETMSAPSFPPPILILTPPGLPGQSLAAALGQGPVAYDVPELNLEQMEFTDALQRELIGFRGMQMLGLLRAIAEIYGGEQTGLSIDMARRWITTRAHLPTADVAQELAARIAPRRLTAPVTSAIFDRLTMKQLIKTFPNAEFVRLTVHPITYGRVMTSLPAGEAALMLTGAIDESVEPAEYDPQELWMKVETQLEPVLSALPDNQLHHFDVADWMADPHAALKRLTERLALPSDDAAIAPMMYPERSKFAGPGPMNAPLASQIDSFAKIVARFTQPEPDTLDGALPWRDDGSSLRSDVRSHAMALGYL